MKHSKILMTVAALLTLALPVLAAAAPGDDVVRGWVQKALQDDPRVASPVGVSVLDNIVTLTGSLKNLAEKQYAVLEARKISGVMGVIDETVVKPVFRLDTALVTDIERRLADSPSRAIRGLVVTAADGQVTLRGEVASWSEKQQAGLLASEVRGVRKLDNEVEIVYGEPRTDDQILHDVRASLDRDVYLVGLPIRIAVTDGTVTLTGEAGSVFARERATQAAWVDGVDQVRNEVEVVWWEDRGARTAYPAPTDAAIAKSVRNELFQDLRIDTPYHIAVRSVDGHVTLTGTVPTLTQKQIATRNARDVVGVGWVTNELQVETPQRSDNAIRADVLQRLDTDYLTNGQDLQVLVENGVVTLAGNTNTFHERSHAQGVAAAVPGVREVVDAVTVNLTRRYTDDRLKSHIEDRLASHDATHVAAYDIKVSVENGTATLTGNVHDWYERKEAGRIAFLTDGVLGLHNELTVEGYAYPWDEWLMSTVKYYDSLYDMYPTLG